MSITGSPRSFLNRSSLAVSPTLPQFFHSVQRWMYSPKPLLVVNPPLLFGARAKVVPAGRKVEDLLREFSNELGSRCTTGGGELWKDNCCCRLLLVGDVVGGTAGREAGEESFSGEVGSGLVGVIGGPCCITTRGGVFTALMLPGTLLVCFQKVVLLLVVVVEAGVCTEYRRTPLITGSLLVLFTSCVSELDRWRTESDGMASSAVGVEREVVEEGGRSERRGAKRVSWSSDGGGWGWCGGVAVVVMFEEGRDTISYSSLVHTLSTIPPRCHVGAG